MITDEGISGTSLTNQEFDLLGYLDSRVYLESSISRFAEWHSSFDPDHPDWPARVEVQRQLGEALADAVAEFYEDRSAPIKAVFLGASLGSIATYFALGALKRRPVDVPLIHIYDYLLEPLQRTRAGAFSMGDHALADMGYADVLTEIEYKRLLADVSVSAGSVTELPFPDGQFDVVVAPYIHHHLNYFDKKKACEEMMRVCNHRGLLAVGDLTFDWKQFNEWLANHSTEEYPYAVESFVSCDDHIRYFGPGMNTLKHIPGSFYYCFVLRREEGMLPG